MMVLKALMAIAVRSLIPLLILAAGVGGFVILGQRDRPPSQPKTTPVPVVETVAVEKHTQELAIDVDGVAVPYRVITLAAEVAGRITEKNELCRPGKVVTEGMPLFTIDQTDYLLEKKMLEAELQQAENTWKETKVELTNTKEELVPVAKDQWQLQKNNLNRVVQLHARNAATISDVETARDSELKARNSLKTLENQVRLFDARLNRLKTSMDVVTEKINKAKAELARTEIKSPISGVVVQSSIEKDDHVQKGTTLITIEDTSKVEIKSNLRMEELAWVWRQVSINGDVKDPRGGYQLPKTPVQVIYTLGRQEYVWDGVLDRFDGIGMDEKTRTIPCRVVVDKPQAVAVRWRGNRKTETDLIHQTMPQFSGPTALVRGMFVTVRILTKPQTPLLTFPENAIRPGNVVWRLSEKNNATSVLEIVPVEVAQIQGRNVIIRADTTELKAGDRLITTPLDFVENGAPVKEENSK